MSNAVTFAFTRFQRVRIREIDSSGFVSSRMNNADGVNEYKVLFWMDGTRKDDWFYEFELEPGKLELA